MKITKSHCRFTMFDYSGGQFQVSIKLELKRKTFISLLQPFKMGRKMDR